MWRMLFAAIAGIGVTLSHADVKALVIGCTYATSKTIPHLDCPANDVKLFEQILKTKPENLKELVSTPDVTPSKSTILDEFQRRMLNCTGSDVFVFFFSGHGALSPSGRSCLVPDGSLPQDYDPDRDFITVAALRSQLQHYCKAKLAILVLDSCYSGGKSVTTPEAKADNAGGPKIFTFAASGPNQQAYETTDHYSVFTMALAQTVAADDSKLGDSSLDIDRFSSHLKTRVQDLCRSQGLLPQDPVVIAQPNASLDIFNGQNAMAPSLAALIKQPQQSLKALESLKRGIGILLKCDKDLKLAERFASAIREKLLDNNYPVFSQKRSAELASVIDKTSSLVDQDSSADLSDRLLIGGDISCTYSPFSEGGETYKTAHLSITLYVEDLRGNHQIEYSSDNNGGDANSPGLTEETAIAHAIPMLVDRIMLKIKPQLDRIITQHMPSAQGNNDNAIQLL